MTKEEKIATIKQQMDISVDSFNFIYNSNMIKDYWINHIILFVKRFSLSCVPFREECCESRSMQCCWFHFLKNWEKLFLFYSSKKEIGNNLTLDNQEDADIDAIYNLISQ